MMRVARTRHPTAQDRQIDGTNPMRSGTQVGRGERHSPATTDLPITMRLAELPEPFDWLRSA